MATIVLIVIGVISLLVKRNKLTREVFCWLAAGREHLMFFFPPKKARNERWEVVLRSFQINGLLHGILIVCWTNCPLFLLPDETRGNKFHVFQEGTNIWEEICQTLLNF
jgi:hypothetical protein